MKNILITGGCGFIGSNFIRLALKTLPGCRLVNLDKLTYAGNLRNLSDVENDVRYRFVHGNICDEDFVGGVFKEEKIDTVVHFAAESHVDRSIAGPAPFIQTNIVGTFTLLEAARKLWLGNSSLLPPHSSRFLHISTDEVYGSLGETGRFTEKTPYNPRSPYSASKASADHLVRAWHTTYGLPVIITTSSNNYGPRQCPEKLIPLMILNALSGKELPVYGDGENVRDWLYVEDHCRALIEVLQKGRIGESYNLGGNQEKQNIEVVRSICHILDEVVGLLPSGQPRTSLVRFVQDQPGHDRRYAIDSSYVQQELGWRPRVCFEEGIRRTVDWYLDHWEPSASAKEFSGT